MLLQSRAGRNCEKTKKQRKNEELFVRQHARAISCSTTWTVPWRNSLLWDSPREVSPVQTLLRHSDVKLTTLSARIAWLPPEKCSLRFSATRGGTADASLFSPNLTAVLLASDPSIS